MAALLVHHQLRLIVGTPESKGHKPGVQQAGMVRVLNVLLHEIPVARDSLAVVAKDLQAPAIECAIEIAKNLRSQEIFEGLDIVIERSEHDAAARRDLELGETVILQLEICRHAPVNPAVLLHAAPEGNPLQIPLQ